MDLRASALEALDGADAAILVTEWPEFAELDWAEAAERMANPLLIDGRNFLDPEQLRAAGFAYEGIGHGAPVEVVDGVRQVRDRRPDAGPDPGRWGGHAAAAADRDASRSR